MSTQKIDRALVAAYVAGAFGLSTAYENEAFTPPTDTAWAELFVVPNQPSVATLGDAGSDAHDGIMQINLNYPAGSGRHKVAEMVDRLRAHFKAGARFDYHGQQVVVSSCGAGPGRQVDGCYQRVVTINWYARTPR